MCSANDDPSTYTAPTPTKPRTYLLSGSVPPARVGASVALAVLGEMLSEAEREVKQRPKDIIAGLVMETLREARERITAAEAEYADGTVRG